MKQHLLNGLLGLLLLSAGVLFFYHRPLMVGVDPDAGNDNDEAIQKRERLMLADPATGEIPAGMAYKNAAFLSYLQQQQPTARIRGVNWVSRGPWNVGGRTRALAIDVQNEHHLLAGGVSGGIWESLDDGNSWTRVSDINGHPGVVSITQDPRPGKTNLWYALSGELYGTSASGGKSFYLGDGAFKSLDNGHTWTPITSTAGGTPNSFTSNFQGGWRIAASPVDSLPACLYMATYGSIYRSKDTGKTWKAVLGSGNASYFTDIKISPTGIVYATVSSDGKNTKGFFRSGDGVTFTNITPSFLRSYNRTVIEINPDDENEVYFLSELPADTSGGVTTTNYEGTKEFVALTRYHYLSGNGSGTGGTWTNLSANLPVSLPNSFDRFNCQGGYDLVLKKQPGTGTLIVGGTNLYRSTDAFNTTAHIQQVGGYAVGTTLPFFGVYLNHHPDQHDLFYLKSDPAKAYSVSDGGVRYTSNINSPAVEWTNRNMGYVTSQLYSVAMDEKTAFDPWLVAGFQDNGNYVSNTTDPYHKWVMPVNGDGAINYMAQNRAYYVMSIQQGRLAKVELDAHGYLLARRRIDPDGFDKKNYSFINPFLVDPVDQPTLYLPIGKKMARLPNLDAIPVNNDYSQLKNSWTILSDTIRTANIDSTTPAEITALAASTSQPHIVYLGTSNQEMYRIDQANTGDPQMVLLDTGSHRLPASGYVSGIDVDPDSANNVLICYSNYNIYSLYFSNDYGVNWYYVGGNLEKGSANPTGGDPSIRCVKILKDPHTGKRIFMAGTSIGLFSTDTLFLSTSPASGFNKTTWKQESADKIGAAIVTDIKYRASDGYVAVATHGSGAFATWYFGDTPPVIPVADVNVTAYPNPANDKIYFSFDATGTSSFHAEVYDISGRRVEAFSNGINNNTIFTQTVDVSHYRDGHYFITFYMDDHRKQVKQFIVHHHN